MSDNSSSPQILDTSTLMWRIARKTCPLRAKPMSHLLVDATVARLFQVDTLEGHEPVSARAILCIGQNNEAWQQTSEKLLTKYAVVEIDSEGWLVCVPKPENSVEFFEIPAETAGGYIVGQWGATVGGIANLQRFEGGDVIARNPEDRSDQWIVRRAIWLNTYTELTRA